MKKFFLITYFFLITVICLSQNEGKRIVAVFNPVIEGIIPDSSVVKAIIREELSTILSKKQNYTVVSRETFDKACEYRYQCMFANDEERIDLGKALAAKYICYANITMNNNNNNYYIWCKMINIETTKIELQASGSSVKELNMILSSIDEIANKMFINPEMEKLIDINIAEINSLLQYSSFSYKNGVLYGYSNKTEENFEFNIEDVNFSIKKSNCLWDVIKELNEIDPNSWTPVVLATGANKDDYECYLIEISLKTDKFIKETKKDGTISQVKEEFILCNGYKNEAKINALKVLQSLNTLKTINK